MSFALGQRVFCKYGGGSDFYPGAIAAVHKADSSYDVIYDDGDTDDGVAAHRLVDESAGMAQGLGEEEEGSGGAGTTAMLSGAAAEALSSCLLEQAAELAMLDGGVGAGAAGGPVVGSAADPYVTEDFGMSQFWYDDETAERMAREMLRVPGRLGFISCPTAFRALKRLAPERKDVFCFEYDRRFGQLWGQQYVFYDCHKPLELPAALHHSFDALIADPPYLNPTTMGSFGSTLRLLARADNAAAPPVPCVLVTGATLQDEVKAELGFDPAPFEPRHSSNIMNRLLCYCNFDALEFATPHSALLAGKVTPSVAAPAAPAQREPSMAGQAVGGGGKAGQRMCAKPIGSRGKLMEEGEGGQLLRDELQCAIGFWLLLSSGPPEPVSMDINAS